MKTLKLNKMSGQLLSKKQQSLIVGGSMVCGCACAYEGRGGSSADANGVANRSGGLFSAGVLKRVYTTTMEFAADSIVFRPK
jgi:natural product precursor